MAAPPQPLRWRSLQRPRAGQHRLNEFVLVHRRGQGMLLHRPARLLPVHRPLKLLPVQRLANLHHPKKLLPGQGGGPQRLLLMHRLTKLQPEHRPLLRLLEKLLPGQRGSLMALRVLPVHRPTQRTAASRHRAARRATPLAQLLRACEDHYLTKTPTQARWGGGNTLRWRFTRMGEMHRPQATCSVPRAGRYSPHLQCWISAIP